MKSLAQGGNKRAKLVMKYEEKYDKFLNSVLIGNRTHGIIDYRLQNALLEGNFHSDLLFAHLAAVASRAKKTR